MSDVFGPECLWQIGFHLLPLCDHGNAQPAAGTGRCGDRASRDGTLGGTAPWLARTSSGSAECWVSPPVVKDTCRIMDWQCRSRMDWQCQSTQVRRTLLNVRRSSAWAPSAGSSWYFTNSPESMPNLQFSATNHCFDSSGCCRKPSVLRDAQNLCTARGCQRWKHSKGMFWCSLPGLHLRLSSAALGIVKQSSLLSPRRGLAWSVHVRIADGQTINVKLDE